MALKVIQYQHRASKKVYSLAGNYIREAPPDQLYTFIESRSQPRQFIDQETGKEFRQKVLALARAREYITRQNVMEELAINSSQAYRILKKLAVDGLLIPINKGRHAKYTSAV